MRTDVVRPSQTCHSKDGGSCLFCWRGRAWLTIWDRVKIPWYSHKLMHRKRVTSELHDSYFCSRMIKICHSKDSGSSIFHWPFMGRDWVGIELLYNSVHKKFNQFGDQPVWGSEELEKWCCRENSTQQRAGPLGLQLSNPGEQERHTAMTGGAGEVNMLQFCLVSNSLSHTTLSNKVRGIFF